MNSESGIIMSTITAVSSSRRARRMGKVLPLVAAVAFCLDINARAATIVVNDASAGSVAGMCTLADAVTAVNTRASVKGCMAGDPTGDNTIDLTGFTTPTTISFTQATSGFSHALAVTQQ